MPKKQQQKMSAAEFAAAAAEAAKIDARMAAENAPPQQPKRRQKAFKKDERQGISNGSIRRLCRRAGVKRIRSDVYAESREVMYNFLDRVLSDAWEVVGA